MNLLVGIVGVVTAAVVLLAGWCWVLWRRVTQAEWKLFEQRSEHAALEAVVGSGLERLAAEQRAGLDRIVADQRRLETELRAVDLRLQGHDARLSRLAQAADVGRTSAERLAFRVAGVAARLSLGLRDLEAQAARAAALSAEIDRLGSQSQADRRFQQFLEQRIDEGEARLREHADWLGRSHEPWLHAHDARVSALEARAEQGEALAAIHGRWLDQSHEPWLARHDLTLAEQQDRLDQIEARAAAVQAEIVAYHRWLDEFHEPWLKRHDADLAMAQAAMAALGERVERDEAVLAACSRWLADSHEPWLERQQHQLARLSERLEATVAPDALKALETRMRRRFETQLRERVADRADGERRELATLTQLSQDFDAKLAGVIGWLNNSHEPWLLRHERVLSRLQLELPTFVSALEQEVAASGRILAQILAVIEEIAPVDARGKLAAPRQALLASKLRRRDARQRGLLPTGVPGPCEGIRLSRGRRPILVVAYSGMQDVFGWLPRLEALDVQVVHLVDTSETWYVDGCDGVASPGEMMERTREAIAGFDYERLVVIGQSMGGYAALRFGPELGADLIGVFGPQTHHLEASTLDYGQFLETPARVVDVRPGLIDSGVATHIFVSRSERDGLYVWDDHAHLEGLNGRSHIHTHVCASDDHGVSGYVSRQGKMNEVLESLFSLAAGGEPLIDLDAI